MLRQSVQNIWFFACFLSCWENPNKSLRAAEKSQGADEKNKGNFEANCTDFSAEFFGSQSVDMFCFCQENKTSNIDNFFLELDKNLPTSS